MLDSVWLVLPKTKELVSPFELCGASKPIGAAQPFTISLISAMVTEDLDGILRGKNDVLILTRTSLGEQPQVERIHFYEEEIPSLAATAGAIFPVMIPCSFAASTLAGLIEKLISALEQDEQERILMAEVAKNEALKPFLPKG